MPLGGASSRLVHPRFHATVQDSAVGKRGMPDTCTIRRGGSGDGTTTADGDWIPPTPTTVYGPDKACRAQAASGNGQRVTVGDDLVTLHSHLVAIPADADRVLVDDVVTITGSEDPRFVDRTLIVRSVHYSTFIAERLLFCDDHPKKES